MTVEASNLTASINGKIVIRDITITAGDGELHLIIGGNGAGKTTLVKTIAGLLKPSTGRVIVDGVDVTGLPPHERRLGVVLQGAPLLPTKTVKDHILYPLNALGGGSFSSQLVDEIARLLNITHLLERKPWSLSGGERQRVAIATALATGARNLILDEPFSSLDPAYRRDLYITLAMLKSRGYTIIATTHIIENIVLDADMIWVMRDGMIIDGGKPQDLLERPRSSYTLRLLQDLSQGAGRVKGVLDASRGL